MCRIGIKGAPFVDERDDRLAKGDEQHPQRQHRSRRQHQSLTDARDQLRTIVVRSQAGEGGKQRHQQGVGDQAQRGLNQQIGVSKARRRSGDAGCEKQIGEDIDLQHPRRQRGRTHHPPDLTDAGVAPVPNEPKPHQPLTHQGRKLDQPLQQRADQGGRRQNHSSAKGKTRIADLIPQLEPQQTNAQNQCGARHQRRHRWNPEFISSIEGAEPQSDQTRQQGHRRHHLELHHSDPVQLRAQPRADEGDQRIRCQNEQNRDAEKDGAHAGVQRRQDVSSLLAWSPAEHAHHGAMKGTVNPPKKDQQKSRQHIRIVVGVIGSAHAEGGGDHELPHQPAHLAQQSAEGDHQCDALQ